MILVCFAHVLRVFAHLDPQTLPESEVLTFFYYFLAASEVKKCGEKNAVIQSAASAASARGGCASSRLDHGLKTRAGRLR